MTSAIGLLMLAMQLLTVVQTTPNLSPAFKTYAISVANNAIVVANKELAQNAPPPILGDTNTPSGNTPIIPIQVPVQVMADEQEQPVDQSAIVVELTGATPADPENDVPHGTYTVKVTVLDQAGRPVKGAPISMTAEGQTVEKTIDTVTKLKGTDYHTKFTLQPTTSGDIVLEFASGSLTKDFALDVQ